MVNLIIHSGFGGLKTSKLVHFEIEFSVSNFAKNKDWKIDSFPQIYI